MTTLPLRRLAFLSAVLLGATAIVSPAHADDPPARVGRVSYAEGTVSFHAPDQSQWSYAAINYPVTAGLSFWDDSDGRNEIEIGSSVMRMDHGTEVNVLQLTDTVTQVQVDQGAINYRVGALAPGETVEIETPHGAVSLLQPGTYHIEAGDGTHPAIVATLEGDARFIGQHSYLDIGAGEQASAIGEPVAYSMAEAQPNEFDNWSLQRDERERERETVRYVSPETTGYQDLDRYGSWRTVPQYGAVWAPSSVPANWAPYRAGHWAWVAPWGWTWIDDQPWGFAPFHYGRWAQVEDNWVWVPGQVVARPVYAPALVAFSAPPPRPGIEIGLGFATATIGWLALAPNEVYYPPYRPSAQYVRTINYGTVNRTTVQNITDNYVTVNRTVNNYANQQAATIIPQQAFANAQAVQHAALPVPASFHTAAVAGTLEAIHPTQAARMAAAAVPATAAAPRPASGPVSGRERAEEREVRAATPQTLSTAGKVAPAAPEHAAPAQQPAVVPQLREQAVQRPVAPTVAAAPVVAGPNRTVEALHPVEPAHVEAEPERPAAHPVVRQASVEQTPATAPGPAIQTVRPQADLRQRTLDASLKAEAAKPAPLPRSEPARAVTAAVQAVEHKPASAPVAFHPADIQKPIQAAPLKPLPQGWDRGEARSEAAAKPGAEKQENDKDHPGEPH